MFPLNREQVMFNPNNTFELIDEVIENVNNSFRPRVGKCYYNMNDLMNALIKAGVDKKRIKSYAGWVFMGDQLPMHYLIIVVDN